jgi:putative nitroreductase
MADQDSRRANPAEHAFENTFIWKIKVWLQFTGWLLYLANFVAVILLLLIATIGVWPALLVWLPLATAAILALNLCFDIATVRYHLHPKEPLPSANTNMNAFDLMRARVSCRSFQSRLLTPEHLKELNQAVAMQTAPENQIGTDPIRFEYLAAPLTVWPTVGCREFLVAIAPAKYNRLAVIDVGRSLQKVVLQLVRKGISTCWIGPGADQNSIIHYLGDRYDADRDHVICVCAVGYASKFKPLALRAMQRSQRKRLPLAELFFSDPDFSSPLNTTAPPFDRFKRCYEVCQWSPSSYNWQTTRCAAATERIDEVETLIRFDFGANTQSKFYAAVAVGIWCANWETGCDAIGQIGQFQVLSSHARGSKAAPELPRYDVSWVIGGSTV